MIPPVTKDDTRPAGKPTECFYCQQPIGSPHKADCVCFRKNVRVRLTWEIEIDVPDFWKKSDIEFWMNESSSCANNLIRKLNQKFIGDDDDNDEDDKDCSCGSFHGEYIGPGETEREDG